MTLVSFISNLHDESLRPQGRKESRWREKEQPFPLAPSHPATWFLHLMGYDLGFSCLSDCGSGTVSSHRAINSGGEALLSLPHQTQWTVQALPTALSLLPQNQRWCWLTMHIPGIHSIDYWLFEVVLWNLSQATFLLIPNHTKVWGLCKFFTFLEEPHTYRRNHKSCLKW